MAAPPPPVLPLRHFDPPASGLIRARKIRREKSLIPGQ
jgi:hypothetical protein